jgi:RecJ-like exonuclease
MRANRLIAMVLVSSVISSGVAFGAEPAQKTVEALNVDKGQLSGQQVQIKGKVVKVNNNIMGKNFLHVQDGTGAAGTNDITVTSAQTAQVGDVVTVVGKVVTNRDFGAGYTYPLIIEEATITAAK